MAIHAFPSSGPNQMLGWSDLSLTITAEVIYQDCMEAGSQEALIAAGSLARGREPCKAYPGWGRVSPWNTLTAATQPPEGELGWQASRILQEHGILSWTGDEEEVVRLATEQKIRIWPNHVCIAGAYYDCILSSIRNRKGTRTGLYMYGLDGVDGNEKRQ